MCGKQPCVVTTCLRNGSLLFLYLLCFIWSTKLRGMCRTFHVILAVTLAKPSWRLPRASHALHQPRAPVVAGGRPYMFMSSYRDARGEERAHQRAHSTNARNIQPINQSIIINQSFIHQSINQSFIISWVGSPETGDRKVGAPTQERALSLSYISAGPPPLPPLERMGR